MTLQVPMDRVCIVMTSAVGDSVHVLPVITALKRHHPAMHLSWVLQPGPTALMRGHPDVDAFIPFQYGSGWKAYADLRRALRAQRFDLVIDLQVSLKAGIITSFTRAPVKLGFDRARARDANWLFTTHRIPAHAYQHVQDQYFEFLSHLGVAPAPVRWNLGVRDDEREAQRELLGRFERPIASIVVGTSDADRDWMPERWAEVCDALWTDFGLQPVLVGGPSRREQQTATAIQHHARASRPFNALAHGGLRGLVGILDGSALVLALDTAPLHIAVALGKPVVALMAQADPKRSGPYGQGLELVVNAFAEPDDPPDAVIWERRRGRMSRITVADVLERVRRWKARGA
ncbi:MAG: glycosyltransferase family 9 protein [Gemmatimonadaceae bacterium]|nr:glycosyltransferase family 9 protein [Gemmatimonadaceae bacterium]